MELLAVVIMIVVGGLAAIFFLSAFTLARQEGARGGGTVRTSDRDEIVASILFQVAIAGGASAVEAMRAIRQTARVGSRVTPSADLTSWATSFAGVSDTREREQLLDLAVQVAMDADRTFPLRQYTALLDLSFALGFHTDVLARMRDRYGFEYVDHAKDGRPRDADRRGGATTLFVRDEGEAVECLRVLEIEGKASRQAVISAYRRLAAQHHPDRFHGQPPAVQERAAARFIEITRAYERLMSIYRD